MSDTETSHAEAVVPATRARVAVVLLEDTAALLGLVFAFAGVGLTVLTGNGVWDGIGTVFIGALLVLVAVILGIETKSLLVGEGATDEDLAKIENAITSSPEVEHLVHLKTMYLGPDEMLVGAKITLPDVMTLTDIALAINAVEARIREAVPIARVIYLEPDVYVPSVDEAVADSADTPATN